MPNSAEPATANVAHNAIQTTADAPQTTLAERIPERIAAWRYLGASAFLFAFLQALCPAVIAISAVRVFIGLGALAAAAGTDARAAWLACGRDPHPHDADRRPRRGREPLCHLACAAAACKAFGAMARRPAIREQAS